MTVASRTSLFGAALIGIFVSVAADTATSQATSDNDAIVDQDGTDNQARIEQTGSLNRAGSDGHPIFQKGIYNNIIVLQEGIGNRIGVAAPGVSQFGLENTQTIFNQITIQQSSDENDVGSISQRSEGSIANGANSLTILQEGGGLNTVDRVLQTQQDGQAAQIVTIQQSGEFNRIALIDQLANSNAFDQDNRITVRMTGARNGRIGLSGYAAESIVLDNSIVQEAGNGDTRSNGNLVDMLITGDFNRFGIRQGGRMNDVGFITVNGNENQLGMRQDGTENDITIAGPIDGDDNNIGIDQLGTNSILLSMQGISTLAELSRSDRNRLFIRQDGTNSVTFDLEGDDNDFRIDQDFDANGRGGSNIATLSVVGSRNIGRVRQYGENTASLEIFGDDNNTAGFDGRINLAGVSTGFFLQTGDRNEASIFVFGDGNISGTVQSGDEHKILLSISGTSNQAAISQTGFANIGSLMQNGKSNSASVVQK